MADRDWTIDAAHLPRHANEGTLERGRDDWVAAIDACDPDEADSAALSRLREGENAALFDAVFANSPFLTQLALRHVPLCARLLATGPDVAMAHILHGLEQAFADPLSTADAGRLLRRARQQAALVVGLADLAGVWTLAEVTGALTDFADLAVRLALRTLIREGGMRKAWTLPDVPDPERHFGLVCLGMGKLGARELNYSSDIDLVLFHDDQWIDGAQAGELNAAFGRVARGLTGLMDNRTVDGYVFRTDLRLRPDPGATPPVIALSAAETYYHSVGQTWERAAMIKARAICGHPGAVKDAQSILHPFVWRKHLDFYAIADVHAIKNQIHAHKGGAKITVRGHNIKLGRGGIREIEFFAQTQQLIWGGRLPALRVPATTKAIAALQGADLIGAKTAEDMVASYAYLRNLEHRLQMIDDRQTHTVPEDDEGLAHIAAFMGYADAEPFAADLTAHLERVHRHYAVLFEEAARPRSTPGNLVFTGSDNDPETMETLRGLGFEDPERIAPLVRSWFAGRYRAMRTERANHLLTTMLPDILAAFGRTSSPDAAVVRFDRFISGLPSGVQLFSLLYANRHLIALLTELLGTAPRLAELLAADSGLFDAVLQPGFFEDLPTRERIDATLAERLDQAGDYQDALDTVRRVAAEVRFQVGVQMIHGGQTVDAAGNALSDLADAVICALLPWVADDFAQKYGTLPGGAFAVVALGKLGSRELTERSDLDLVFIYDVEDESARSTGPREIGAGQYYAQFCHRLIAALTAPTAEGKLYEVDLRLRPSGKNAPIAVTADAFAAYHEEAAWTWEHLALTRARIVTAPPTLAARISSAINAVVALPRDPGELAVSVDDMRRRVQKEFGTSDFWQVKHADGGLFDLDFIVQYLVLCHGQKVAGRRRDNGTWLEALEEAGAVSHEMAHSLQADLGLWRTVQALLRLTVEQRFDPEAAPAALRAMLVRATGAIDFDALTAQIADAAADVRRHYDEIIGAPAEAARRASEQQEETA